MTDKPAEQNHYEQWITKRRETSPPATLADQVMTQVEELEIHRRSIWWLRLVQQIERSRAARWAVCSGALAVGGLPFFFLAYFAQLVTF